MLSVTFIRHGESMDNLKNIWAGWKDAPLSEYGMSQARALGAFLGNIPFTYIYASDLQRATSTAQAVWDGQIEPKPPLTRTELLREQHWGIAEGHKWSFDTKPGLSLDDHFKQGIFPVLSGRDEHFPEGESLNHLRARADRAIRQLVLPHAFECARSATKNVHIALVSHGLCISEMIPALLDLGVQGSGVEKQYSGMRNTAWSRVTVNVKGDLDNQPLEFPDTDPPPLIMKVTDFNRHDHLHKLGSKKGNAAEQDPNQSDIRKFFGGEAISRSNDVKTEPVNVERLNQVQSNAKDEGANID